MLLPILAGFGKFFSHGFPHGSVGHRPPVHSILFYHYDPLQSLHRAWSCFLFVFQIQIFDLIPGPWGSPQKLQTGLDARITIKAPDIDDSAQLTPLVIFHKFRKNIFQSDAVKRIIGVLVVHKVA